MKNNRLIEIFSSLSKKEMTRFTEFVHSPYFNKHKGVKSLTDYFANIYPKFTDKNCKPETIFKGVSGKAKFDKQKLALLFTYTMRQLEIFMAHEEFEPEAGQHKVLTGKFLRNKKKFKYANKQLNFYEDKLEESELRDSEFLLGKLEVRREIYLNDGLQGKILTSPWLDQKQEYLEYHFLSEKMRDACALLAGSPILKKDTKPVFENFAVKEVMEHPEKYDSVAAIKIYRQIFRMLTTKEESDYNEAKNLINEIEHFFSQEERQAFYSYLQNFCILKINTLESGYYKELFGLYKILLEKELIFENGILSEWNYKNIVTVGTRLNERKWVEDFLVKYKSRLRPDRAENAYSFNLASYYFSVGEMEKVQELLLRVEYTDPRYSLGAKALLLQTYYQTEETEALFSLTDSFRQFLKRNNLLAESRKSGYANLFKLTKRAAKIRSKKGYVSKSELEKDIEKLKKDFEEAGSIFYKGWMKKKIAELEFTT